MATSADIVSVVALIISVISFIVAFAQALQQYISSAEGYRKCAESVMGPWWMHTKRRFSWSEFRFRVEYQTPVFFVSVPANDRGPVDAQPIYNIDGRKESREATRTLKAEQQRVHTVADERATWVNLLVKLQQCEQDSRQWDANGHITPRGEKHPRPDYTMVVQLQARPKLWDFMPDGVSRPYGHSTVSHIAQMAAMLGMSWRTFEPDTANLQAEGNGLSLTSSSVPGVGIVASFLSYDKSVFQHSRVIPAIQVKQLLFGTVPTIFQGQTLNFGDDAAIRRTLKMLKCKQPTFGKYFGVSKHLRSVNFEIIAMLGQAIRLRGSNFKILPNPTRDPWVDTFSSCNLMAQFQRQVALLAATAPPSPQVLFILDAWKEQLSGVWQRTEDKIDIDMREAAHDVLDACDSFLVDECSQASVISVVSAHMAVVLEELDLPNSVLSTLDSDNEADLVAHYFDRIKAKVMDAAPGYDSPATTRAPAASMVSRQDVWLMLMFRMCCWWVLHEFAQDNATVLSPRWRGSRLPVLIL